ncbi:MAG: hypothetical protein ACR2M7_01415 [Bdellovibrionales bacterium]
MEYFIFLISIQFPFCYLIWKFFQMRSSRIARHIRTLNHQSERTIHLLETLRLSFEKSADDMYIRMKKMEAEKEMMKTRLQQLEKYTGLRSQAHSNLLSSINSLQEKDFS